MANFTFTQISDNSSTYRYGNPSINDNGLVSFEAFPGFCNTIGGDCLQTGTNAPPNAIVIGNGNGSTTVIADKSNAGFSNYDSVVLFSSSTNNAGTTVWAGSGYNYGQLAASGPSGVSSRAGDGPVNIVAQSNVPFVTTLRDFNGPFDNSNLAATGNFASAPGINDNGTIAFVAGQNDGQNQTTGLYTQSINGQITKISDTSGPLSNFYLGGLDVQRGQGPFAGYTLPDINDKGEVAFNAGLDNGGKGIFVGDGGSLKPIIAQTQNGPFKYLSVPSLNNADTVALNVGFTTGGSAILTTKDGQFTTIADTSTGYFKNFLSDVPLNEQGQVAFLADYDGGTGIFTGSSLGQLEKVISVGDSLGGSTVTTLFISHDGLNNVGQVAFDAVLADGTQHVFTAEPVPEPGDGFVSVLALAIISMLGYRWRRRMQSAK